MKGFLITILLLLLFSLAKSQIRVNNIDDLKMQLANAGPDTTKSLRFADLAFIYAFLQIDSGI